MTARARKGRGTPIDREARRAILRLVSACYLTIGHDESIAIAEMLTPKKITEPAKPRSRK